MSARARTQLRSALHWNRPFREWPRPGYCACCVGWGWLTNETPSYSDADGSYLCEPCAIINDHETELAWAEYYGSRL